MSANKTEGEVKVPFYKRLSKIEIFLVSFILVIGVFFVVGNLTGMIDNNGGDDTGDVVDGGDVKEPELDADGNPIIEIDVKEEYVDQYGTPPVGFRWSYSGQPIPLGDPTLTNEDVGYIYLRALTSLDIQTAEQFSFKSTVVKNYYKYFDPEGDYSSKQSFEKNLYKAGLLSMIVGNIEDTSIFTQDRTAVTFEVEVLDLSYKDFWLKDKEEIYKNIHQFRRLEGDTEKSKDYLYDYVIKYYESEEALKTKKNIVLTIEKTSDDAWVVSRDSDIDALFTYEAGVSVVDFILDSYNNDNY